MRRLAYFVLVLLLSIALALAGIFGLAATETGTRWLTQLAVRFVPGELRIEKVHGTLLDRLELERLAYRLPAHRFELTRLTLAWQPKALFSGQLKIEEITASGLNYQGPSAPENEPVPVILPAVRLPLKVTIQRAELTDTEIVRGEVRLRLDHVLLDAELIGERFIIRGFRVLARPWSLIATGEVALRGDYPLRLAIDWRGTANGQILAGQGKLSGDLRELTIDHRLTLPFEAVTFGTLNALDPDLPVALEGSWKNLHWPPVTSDYSSPAGSYRVRGNLKAYRLELEAALQGKTLPPLQVRLNGRGDAKSLSLEPLTIHPPQGQLTVTGKVSWAPALAWQLDFKGRDLDPQAFLPDWPGRLDLIASSRGRWDKPKLAFSLKIDRLRGSLRRQPVEAKGTLQFRDGQWQSDELELLSGANRLSLQGRYGKRIDLSFAFDGRELSQLWPGLSGVLKAQGKLAGTPANPGIRAEAQGHRIAWQGNRIGVLKMKLDFTPDDPTSHSEISLSQLQLRDSRIERLELSARGGFDRHRLGLDLKPPQGHLIAALTGSYRAKVWQARIDRVTLEDAKGRRLVFPGDGTLEAEASLDLNVRPPALAGKLDLEIPDLAQLALWLPQLDRPEGRLSVKLHADGPVDNPTPEGRLMLTRGAVGIRAAGIRLTAIEASVAGSGERFDLTGHLRSGEGRLDFSGWADPPGKLHLTLKGNALEVFRKPRITVSASPDLKFDLADRTGRLTGTLLIPKADIRLKELPEGSVTVSKDEIIVGEAKPKTLPLAIESKVLLVLGDEVSFAGFGLSANLAGNLDVSSLNSQARAQGIIDLKQASYQAYGQKLKLAKGRLIFTGPLDQPYLELIASRKIEAEDITASLQVRGPVQKPEVWITSQPPLPQTEALSYLLLGRSFKTGSTDEQTEVAKTALALGMDIALPWIRKLGLEAFAAKAGVGFQEEALGLGKYLTPDLYLGYAFNLFNGVGQAILRYRINRFLSLEAGAGASQNVDLFYTLETD